MPTLAMIRKILPVSLLSLIDYVQAHGRVVKGNKQNENLGTGTGQNMLSLELACNTH